MIQPTGNKKIMKLMELLGIPIDDTVGFVLRCRVGEAVTIEVESFIKEESISNEVKTSKQMFYLEEIGDGRATEDGPGRRAN